MCIYIERERAGSMNSLVSDFVQGIVERYVRGCSGLVRGGFGRFLEDK